jgi:hypothetical protein
VRVSATGLGNEPRCVLFPAVVRKTASYRAGRWCALTPRTCSNDDSNRLDSRLTIRLTHSGRPVSRIFSRMTALSRRLSGLLATPIAGPQSFMIVVDRRFCSRTWRGFDTNLTWEEVSTRHEDDPRCPSSPQSRSLNDAEIFRASRVKIDRQKAAMPFSLPSRLQAQTPHIRPTVVQPRGRVRGRLPPLPICHDIYECKLKLLIG